MGYIVYTDSTKETELGRYLTIHSAVQRIAMYDVISAEHWVYAKARQERPACVRHLAAAIRTMLAVHNKKQVTALGEMYAASGRLEELI